MSRPSPGGLPASHGRAAGFTAAVARAHFLQRRSPSGALEKFQSASSKHVSLSLGLPKIAATELVSTTRGRAPPADTARATERKTCRVPPSAGRSGVEDDVGAAYTRVEAAGVQQVRLKELQLARGVRQVAKARDLGGVGERAHGRVDTVAA
eukprot:3694758-Prymnesium_polylepis.1